MAQLAPVLMQQLFDGNGDPLPGGKLYSYAAGTSAPLVTYEDQTETAPNTNPIILDADGRASVWVGEDAYKFVLTDADDVVIWTQDNVQFLPDGIITTDKLADEAVTTAKLADDAVTEAKIIDNSISETKLQTGAVTEDKIGLEAVTEDKLGPGAVTREKLAALGEQVSSTSGAFNSSATSFTDVTNLSRTITTTGKPVFVALVHDGDTGSSEYMSVGPERNGATTSGFLAFVRGSTMISQYWYGVNVLAAGQLSLRVGGPIFHIDVVAAGTYTYKVQVKAGSASNTMNCGYAKLIVFEMG